MIDQPAKVCRGKQPGQLACHLSQNNSTHHRFQNFQVCLRPKIMFTQREQERYEMVKN